ncbi:MAG: hypothetical protein ACI9JL_000867 [Paracoccaceae bacterium]|jgi:hypothetical protein
MTAGISITINLPGVAASADDLEATGVSVQQADAAPPPPALDDPGDAADLSDVAAAPPDVEGDPGSDGGFDVGGDAMDGFAPPPEDMAGDAGLAGDDAGEPPPPDDGGDDAPAAAKRSRTTTTRSRRKKA